MRASLIALVSTAFLTAAPAIAADTPKDVKGLFLRFWTSRPDAPDFLLRRNTFFSNLAMIGALIYVVVAGPGLYSLM